MILSGCALQIPDMDRIWWLSIFSAIMSFTYATIGVGLSIARVVGAHASLHALAGPTLQTSRASLCLMLLSGTVTDRSVVGAANVRHRPGFIYGTAGGVSVASEGRPTWTWCAVPRYSCLT